MGEAELSLITDSLKQEAHQIRGALATLMIITHHLNRIGSPHAARSKERAVQKIYFLDSVADRLETLANVLSPRHHERTEASS